MDIKNKYYIFFISKNTQIIRKKDTFYILILDVSSVFFCFLIGYLCRGPPSIVLILEIKTIGGIKMVKIPVRNRSKDNPYFLGFDENKKTYTVEFIDNRKVIHKVEISDEIYKALDKFELEDVSQIHKFQRHIEHSELYDETLNNRTLNSIPGVEEIVEQKMMSEDLKNAISTLSSTQKRRIKMYYFDELTQKEIAEREGTSIRAVQYTLNSAISQLQKFFEKK